MTFLKIDGAPYYKQCEVAKVLGHPTNTILGIQILTTNPTLLPMFTEDPHPLNPYIERPTRFSLEGESESESESDVEWDEDSNEDEQQKKRRKEREKKRKEERKALKEANLRSEYAALLLVAEALAIVSTHDGALMTVRDIHYGIYHEKHDAKSIELSLYANEDFQALDSMTKFVVLIGALYNTLSPQLINARSRPKRVCVEEDENTSATSAWSSILRRGIQIRDLNFVLRRGFDLFDQNSRSIEIDFDARTILCLYNYLPTYITLLYNTTRKIYGDDNDELDEFDDKRTALDEFYQQHPDAYRKIYATILAKFYTYGSRTVLQVMPQSIGNVLLEHPLKHLSDNNAKILDCYNAFDGKCNGVEFSEYFETADVDDFERFLVGLENDRGTFRDVKDRTVKVIFEGLEAPSAEIHASWMTRVKNIPGSAKHIRIALSSFLKKHVPIATTKN